MDDNRSLDADREEPPLVMGLIMRGSARTSQAVKRAIGSIDRRTQVLLAAAGTVVVFAGILLLTIVQSPTMAGIAQGLFAGVLFALFFAAGMAWLLLWANSRRPGPALQRSPVVTELETFLAPALVELQAVRREAIKKVKARSVWCIPVAIAAALVLWILAQSGDDPPGVLALLGWLAIGALAGEAWAMHKLEREYRALYKNRVLPRLASRFDALTYQQASHDHVHRLRSHRILGEFDTIDADDEITGTHQGLPLSIIEARLKRRSGKKTRIVFDGLLIELTLPRSLTATTAVLTDEGVIGNMASRWRSGNLERIRLEDPRFEQRFEVYGSDQVEARALLTPAFMERFMALAAGSGFSLPGALAEGNHLMVALPKQLHGDLFEPPPYWKPAGGQALVKLEGDIRAVLRMADSVADLDFWAAGRKGDRAPAIG